MKLLSAICLWLLFLTTSAQAQSSYQIQKIADEVYAAIALPAGKASSNAFFVIGTDWVIAGGAHMTRQGVTDLLAGINEITAKPVRYFLLPHHHSGFTYIDTDFPSGITLLCSGETWQKLEKNGRRPINPVIFFNNGLSIKCGNLTAIFNNLGRGHTEGDVIMIIPERKVLYAGDLLYNGAIGYMGEGFMREWLAALDALTELGAEIIIAGIGPPGTMRDLDNFRRFFRDFLTAVVARIEQGATLADISSNFDLPGYQNLPGYMQFLRPNAERAFTDLRPSLLTD